MAVQYKDLPKKCKPFANHGVEFMHASGETHMEGVCPFCGAQKFYVNGSTGQYKCHKCSVEGNITTFITEWSDLCREETTEENWKALAEDRGLPVAALKASGIAYNELNDWWVMPCRAKKGGNVLDLRRWQAGKGVRSTSSCNVQLYGRDTFLQKNPDCAWICEGEWDAMAVNWLLKRNKRTDEYAVAVPGAGTFKDDWLELFDGKHVYIAYDADDPGDKGSLKVGTLLKRRGRCKSINYLNWSMDAPDGFDVRDWISHGWLEHRHELDAVLYNLEDLFSDTHRLGPNAAEATGVKDEVGGDDWSVTEDTCPDKPVSWDQLLGAFDHYLEMDEDMRWALTLCCATVLGMEDERAKHDPLWFYLIAPPGGGKTTILNTFRGSQRCLFRSSLTPASLVSGFNASRSDPSLIPKLASKTGIFKDGTELLALPHHERAAIDSIFRGAYDGDVDKSYGNAVERIYRDIYFNMVIGMTPAVHAESNAALGERFLKFQMQKRIEDRTEGVLWTALQSVGREAEIDTTLQEMVAAFLWKPVDVSAMAKKLARSAFARRVMALAQLVARVRATVERDRFTREVKYGSATSEMPTRLTKQLFKLGIMITITWELDEPNEEVWRLLERVAFDTCIGFNLDILQSIMMRGGRATTLEIAEDTGYPRTTFGTKFEDMQMLKLLAPPAKRVAGVRGRPGREHVVTDELRELWDRVRPQDDHTKQASAIRRRRSKEEAADAVPTVKVRMRKRRKAKA